MAIDLLPERNAPGTARSGNGDTLVIVPMYNEAQVITQVITTLRGTFTHVLCVDDGSRDDSAALAAAAGAHVLTHPVNLGQGAALQTGLTHGLRTTADYFVTFDADGQHSIEDTVAMLGIARAGDVDIVLGSRFLGVRPDVPTVRRAVLRAGVLFTRLTTGLRLTDTHNGLRVMTRATARTLNLRLSGMAHASEILSAVARGGLRYREVPMTVLYTDYSRSKGQSSLNALNIVFDLALARARYAR
jgi:glycosyltransferase involved in cell wall biosynthesis